MLSATESVLTFGGMIALGSLALGAIGLGLNTAGKNAELRERIATLETLIADHLRNGASHGHKE